MILDQFWRCPECGAEMATGPPVRLGPPVCQLGHRRVECEQITAPAFGRHGSAEEKP